MLQNKPRKGAAWLPTQVVYGMDCSDEDPAKWKPFGLEQEQQLAAKERAAVTSNSKAAAAQPPARE